MGVIVATNADGVSPSYTENGYQLMSLDSALSPPSVTVEHIYEIDIVEDVVQFFVDDVLMATVSVPSSQAYPFNAGRQTVFARTFNGGVSPATAPQLGIGQVDGGRFLHVIVEVPVGTATGSQIFRGDVVLNGYYE